MICLILLLLLLLLLLHGPFFIVWVALVQGMQGQFCIVPFKVRGQLSFLFVGRFHDVAVQRHASTNPRGSHDGRGTADFKCGFSLFSNHVFLLLVSTSNFFRQINKVKKKKKKNRITVFLYLYLLCTIHHSIYHATHKILRPFSPFHYQQSFV